MDKGKSRKIVETLMENIKTTFDDDFITYEMYRELPDDLESRKDINTIRIALYSNQEEDIVKVGAEKPADGRQFYGIDISVVRAYQRDKASDSELVALDVKDALIDWIKAVDPFTVTGGALSSLGYEGSTGFTRRKRYITQTMNLSGFRDLNSQQTIDEE